MGKQRARFTPLNTVWFARNRPDRIDPCYRYNPVNLAFKGTSTARSVMLEFINHITHDGIGLAHLLTAVVALICGTAVLAMPKGTRLHRWVGYVYASSMAVMLLSAFLIYRVFDGFGLFHIFAVVSTLTLFAGMIPAWRRGPRWLEYHIGFMYWSVIGLYGALAAEVFARVPSTPFFTTIALVVAGVMIFGEIGWRRYGPRWTATWTTRQANSDLRADRGIVAQ